MLSNFNTDSGFGKLSSWYTTRDDIAIVAENFRGDILHIWYSWLTEAKNLFIFVLQREYQSTKISIYIVSYIYAGLQYQYHKSDFCSSLNYWTRDSLPLSFPLSSLEHIVFTIEIHDPILKMLLWI